MPAYIALYNFTEQGIHNVKGTVDRARAAKKAAEGMGIRVIGVWWTLGQYDMVTIAEGPEEAMTQFLLVLAGQGNVRSMSMRAFSEDEMAQIVQGLP